MMMATSTSEAAIARVNGVPLHAAGAELTAEELRQRAGTELLRQAAQRAGLLAADDAASADGVISEAAQTAIESWLEQQIQLPEPEEHACRRWHAAHAARYNTGEAVRARHILFAVTPGTDVVALRNRAETCLLDVRCHDGKGNSKDSSNDGGEQGDGSSDAFARSARQLSNCPSGEHGGDLGWLTATDCAPEFARELFGHVEVGVLPRLVHSRFGLHVVEVLERRPGVAQPFEQVRGAVAMALSQQAYATALRQCLLMLAGEADVRGVDLDAADTPLVQ